MAKIEEGEEKGIEEWRWRLSERERSEGFVGGGRVGRIAWSKRRYPRK